MPFFIQQKRMPLQWVVHQCKNRSLVGVEGIIILQEYMKVLSSVLIWNKSKLNLILYKLIIYSNSNVFTLQFNVIATAPQHLPHFTCDVLNTTECGYYIHVMSGDFKLEPHQYDMVIAFNGVHHYIPTREADQHFFATWNFAVAQGMVENARHYIAEGVKASPEAKSAMSACSKFSNKSI